MAISRTYLHRDSPEDGVVLVEILVVAVIVAILAAVAIPIYTGTVLKQRRDLVSNLAQTAAVSANVFYRRNGVNPTDSDLDIYLPDSSRYGLSVSGNTIIAKDSLGGSDIVRDTVSFR